MIMFEYFPPASPADRLVVSVQLFVLQLAAACKRCSFTNLLHQRSQSHNRYYYDLGCWNLTQFCGPVQKSVNERNLHVDLQSEQCDVFQTWYVAARPPHRLVSSSPPPPPPPRAFLPRWWSAPPHPALSPVPRPGPRFDPRLAAQSPHCPSGQLLYLPDLPGRHPCRLPGPGP